MRSMRLVTLLLAALVALHGVAADADCVGDGVSCSTITEMCPKVCCSGMPPRMSGSSMYCLSSMAALRGTLLPYWFYGR
jgi:hypothetical protein